MNTAATVFASVAASTMTALTISTWMSPTVPAPATEAAAPGPDSGQLPALRAEVSALARRVDSLALHEPPTLTRSSSTGDTRDIEAVVLRLLGEAGAPGGPSDPALASASDTGEDAALLALVGDPLQAVAAIRAAGFGTDEASAIWQAAADQGVLDELLEVLRDDVTANPQSPEAHLELARGALAAAQQNPNHPEGSWWRESDEAYGEVLELDPTHSLARYEKAVNLCFWPDAFGRRPEAVRHFELLVDGGSEEGNPDAHRQSFLWLGNMYVQSGRVDDARAIWERGLSAYPDSESLLSKLDDLDFIE